jgi:hypothetical protein
LTGLGLVRVYRAVETSGCARVIVIRLRGARRARRRPCISLIVTAIAGVTLLQASYVGKMTDRTHGAVGRCVVRAVPTRRAVDATR